MSQLATTPAAETTLSIIKPDAVKNNKIGEIMSRIENAGLKVVAGRFLHLSEEQAKRFYAAHASSPFFSSLVKFMSSGPVWVQVLHGVDAIKKYRNLMGVTDPSTAEPGTLRADFATDIEKNAVHGSDSPAAADIEISFFFAGHDIHLSCKW